MANVLGILSDQVIKQRKIQRTNRTLCFVSGPPT